MSEVVLKDTLAILGLKSDKKSPIRSLGQLANRVLSTSHGHEPRPEGVAPASSGSTSGRHA
jgi:hypothetical protein